MGRGGGEEVEEEEEEEEEEVEEDEKEEEEEEGESRCWEGIFEDDSGESELGFVCVSRAEDYKSDSRFSFS